MFEIAKKFTFEAAHRLPKVPSDHPCGRTHGHSYTVELAITGDLDPNQGWVMDFADIGRAFAPLRGELDHELLNDIDGLENPTSEILAVWIFTRLRPALPTLTWVAVNETATSRCVYQP